MDMNRMHSWEPTCEELPYDPEYSEETNERFFLDSMIDSVNMEPLFQMMVDKAA